MGYFNNIQSIEDLKSQYSEYRQDDLRTFLTNGTPLRS